MNKPVTGSGFQEPIYSGGTIMRYITLEQLADILGVMTITHSIDCGFAVTHHGHIEGQPTLAISTCRGEVECILVQ
ncbi:hypothetical protein D9M68_983400 [compost metagenome]